MHPQASAFFDTIRPWQKAYKDVRISYLAAFKESNFQLIQARAEYVVTSLPIDLPRFASGRVIAGQFLLSSTTLDFERLIDRAITGVFQTPDDTVLVGRGTGQAYAVTHFPLHPDAVAVRRRNAVLRIDAGSAPKGGFREELDWELRACLDFYDGLPDLAATLGLDTRLEDAFLTVSAPHAAEIDGASVVDGTIAKPACFLADGLEPSDLRINYRVQLNNKTVRRAAIGGTAMTWTQGEKAPRGEAEISIPAGAVVQCAAVVNGHAHHHLWIADPKTFANPMRTLLEGYDPELKAMKAILFEADRRGGGDTRAVESAVAWLLWMLGFAPAHFGSTKQLQDGPDVLAMTPSHNIMMVECTTGMLKADKLARLAERRTNLRERLNASGHNFLRIVAAIATTMRRSEVEADIEYAERHGILVFAREDLETGLSRTLISQDPELGFRQAEDAIKAARDKRSSANEDS